MGALGHYLGLSTKVETLHISLPEDVNMDTIAPFLSGLRFNKSIHLMHLYRSHIPRDFFRVLAPFIKGNPNLTNFIVQRCEMDADQYRSLSLALREGSSLKSFAICGRGRYDHEESIIANIEALKMHPQLEHIFFHNFSMGRDVCAALTDLLRHSAVGVRLVLRENNIDDSGLESLLDGLAHCGGLETLNLSRNPSITIRGWRALAALLENPNSNLQALDLQECGINDDGATIFANALKNNRTLTELYLNSNVESSGEGWKAFSKVLCDTSSVNSTFLSNHTLMGLNGPGRVPGDIRSLLRLNERRDKKDVAVRKILEYHDDFDMQPLFEWDLKVLPHVVEGLERAAAYQNESEARTQKRKLSAIYQFIRGMPELAVEGIAGVNEESAQMVGAKRPLRGE